MFKRLAVYFQNGQHNISTVWHINETVCSLNTSYIPLVQLINRTILYGNSPSSLVFAFERLTSSVERIRKNTQQWETLFLPQHNDPEAAARAWVHDEVTSTERLSSALERSIM